MMPEFENQELAEWLEDGVREMFNRDPNAIAIVASLNDGTTLTGYYKADATQKALFAHQIYTDAVLDVVMNNAGLIKRALDELEDGGGEDE